MTERHTVGPAAYVISGTLRRALRQSRIPQIELASRVGLSQPRLSALLRGIRFSAQTLGAIITLGGTLGVSGEQCARYVGRKRS